MNTEQEMDGRLSDLRSTLSDDAFASALDVGKGLTLEQAAEYALES